MIDKSKTYRTRDGREVRIYATDGGEGDMVHGAIHIADQWIQFSWRADGSCDGRAELSYDLIEVRPRHKRTVWLNVYSDGARGVFTTKEYADGAAYTLYRIACIKVDLDFEEGEGL